MKFLLKTFLIVLSAGSITILLTMCEKQKDETTASSLSASNTETSDHSASDRSPVTSCIECDLEWRFLCDEVRCDGGDYGTTVVTLNAKEYSENSCCFNYSSQTQWSGKPVSVSWQPLNPGVLKSSVYAAMGSDCSGSGASLCISALVGTQKMPGIVKIQFRKSGDNTGATLTQHNIPLNGYPEAPCSFVNLGTGDFCPTGPTVVPVSIENDCRVNSIYRVAPEVTEMNSYMCPSGGPREH